MSVRRRFVVTLAVALLLGPAAATAGAPAPAGHAALDSLVAAEQAFARMSLERGVRDAFLHWMAPDGVIFRPRATNARRAWESRGPVAARLAWSPVFAEVSAAGDLGFTTGPWELRPDDAKLPFGHGHFVSVWQKQGDGTWRVAVDIGISHAKPARGVGMDEVTPGPVHRAPRAGGPLPDLLALDVAWTVDARARGPRAAFARRAARDVRYCRDAVTPVVGAPGAREMVRLLPGATRWDPEAQRVARSGDLGCTYGILERRAPGAVVPDSSVYLHVWRREAGGWKVALALETALPKRGR